MKYEQLDEIMKKNITDKNSPVNVVQTVMERIEEYEKQKSGRIICWEYLLSCLILFAGILSIVIIQFIFSDDYYSMFYKWFSIYISAMRWILTVIFSLISLSIISFILFISAFRTDKKILQKYI